MQFGLSLIWKSNEPDADRLSSACAFASTSFPGSSHNKHQLQASSRYTSSVGMATSVSAYGPAMRHLFRPSSRTLRYLQSATQQTSRSSTNTSRPSTQQPLSSKCLQHRQFSSSSRRPLPGGADQVKNRTGVRLFARGTFTI